jgi:hypothetical protein
MSHKSGNVGGGDDDYEGDYLPGHNALQFSRDSLTFERNILPPSSGSKANEASRLQALLTICLCTSTGLRGLQQRVGHVVHMDSLRASRMRTVNK